ncbi:MAG TPA: DNA repair protein RadC [Polyangiaceae bacterium]|nr:DNA repair protein RadC [Polyangiaceae bacterium]
MPDARERALTSGVETLPDQDLLAIVIGTGISGESVFKVAARLLESEGGLFGLARGTPQGLRERRGLGPVKAVRIAAAFELGRRAQAGALSAVPPRLLGFDEVVAWARPRFSLLEHEEVWLLALDGQNALKSSRKIAQGGAHGCALTTRDVLAPALRDAASAIVLVHNHPSGDPTPSPEDVQMTRAVAAACDVVGIPLLDHVVVARGGASSLFERGAF